MSTTTATTTAEPAEVRIAAKKHRELDVISAELEEARAGFLRMEKENAEYDQVRRSRIKRRETLEARWKRDNPTEPFDPTAFVPPAVIPPADSPVQGKFHAQHYLIGRLMKELAEAKLAITGV